MSHFCRTGSCRAVGRDRCPASGLGVGLPWDRIAADGPEAQAGRSRPAPTSLPGLGVDRSREARMSGRRFMMGWSSLPMVLMLLAGGGTSCGEEERRCYDDVDCGGGVCEDHRCEARRGKGESCLRGWGYVEPGTQSNCKPGLICRGDPSSPVCARASGIGGPCTTDGDCGAHPGYRHQDDLICDVSGGTGICAAPRSVPSGAACNSERACAGALRCGSAGGASMFCLGPGTEGETCHFDSFYGPGDDPRPSCEPGRREHTVKTTIAARQACAASSGPALSAAPRTVPARPTPTASRGAAERGPAGSIRGAPRAAPASMTTSTASEIAAARAGSALRPQSRGKVTPASGIQIASRASIVRAIASVFSGA